MAKEDERKFLVDGSQMNKVIPSTAQRKVHIATYFTQPPLPAVRCTYSPSTGRGKFCVKTGTGQVREENETQIPFLNAVQAVEQGPTKLIKIRYDVEGWEIDAFLTMSLWMAEWEVHNGNAPLGKDLPKWIIKEVTNDPEYTNQALAWKYGKKA